MRSGITSFAEKAWEIRGESSVLEIYRRQISQSCPARMSSNRKNHDVITLKDVTSCRRIGLFEFMYSVPAKKYEYAKLTPRLTLLLSEAKASTDR
eukprot:scaffold22939_cov49-Attheya_sp.AAC.4